MQLIYIRAGVEFGSAPRKKWFGLLQIQAFLKIIPQHCEIWSFQWLVYFLLTVALLWMDGRKSDTCISLLSITDYFDKDLGPNPI